MQTSKEHIDYLWQQYCAKKATDKELNELFSLLEDADGENVHLEYLQQAIGKTPPVSPNNEVWQPVIDNILKNDPAGQKSKPTVHRVHFLKTAWFRYAAAILILTVSVYSWNARNNIRISANLDVSHSVSGVNNGPDDAFPGGNKAILTLADGSQIILDSASSGNLGHQGNSNIIKLGDGQLAYQSSGAPTIHPKQPVINTISTPRGGQYQVLLPDGTKVRLNAASSLTFPASFMGNRREVAVTGEAYFEVATDAIRPFHVKINNKTEVEVLGTDFNVNAYEDEPVVRTTLVNGSIKVKSSETAGPVLLRPNEELTLQGDKATVNKVDVETSVAWIHGKFNFKSADLQMVLRDVSRWYDVDIKYEEKINSRFSGSMYRSENMSELLKIIEFTGKVKFAINQKTVTVSLK